jgi:hypothetical protein
MGVAVIFFAEYNDHFIPLLSYCKSTDLHLLLPDDGKWR